MAVHNNTHNQVLRPANIPELFSIWNRFPDAVPYAGGTGIMRSGSDPGGVRGVFREQPELPDQILSLERIDDLRGITRTERYLEFGAMVHLSEIIALGKIVPGAFSQTILGIAGPLVRNMASIGGNIYSKGDTIAPLCALDAVYELRNANSSRWISAIRYSALIEKNEAPLPGELITRIRIPLEEWNYSMYRKFTACEASAACETSAASETGVVSENGVLILVVQNHKNMLANINVVFAGDTLLRDKDSEFFLEGKALPLDKRDANHFRKLWESYLENVTYPRPLLRSKILNAIETGIAGLSD